MIRTKLVRAALVALATVVATARGGALADDSGAANAAAAKAASVVHLKCVLKRGDREFRRSIPSVMVDASGLLLCSTSALGTGGTGRFKANATDLKVVFGADPKEYPAVLVAQDTKVDLAFAQILDLEGRVVTPVDLSKQAAIDVGTEVWQVVRKSSGFDYAAVVGTGYVTCRVEKPRPMWGIAGDARQIGLPVYDAAGGMLGVVTRQMGAEGGEEGPMRAFG